MLGIYIGPKITQTWRSRVEFVRSCLPLHLFEVLTVQRMSNSILFHTRPPRCPKRHAMHATISRPIRKIVCYLVAILSATDHLPKLIFLGELALELIKLSDKVLA
jgi:hypothetical protein